MAMKSPDFLNERPLLRLLVKLVRAPAALSVIWPALLIIASYFAWHHWGAERIASQFRGIDPQQIQITPPPEYVRTDLVSTVYRDTSMEGLSLLDPQSTAKIASAFAMNPWVRRVTSVRKLPGGQIDVRIQYRSPVAMVLIEKPEDPGAYFLPVDGEGVLLPTSEFARAETLQFIHIVAPGAQTSVSAGTPFGDTRVEQAARLAEILSGVREQARIVSINVSGDPRWVQVPKFELITLVDGDDGKVSERRRFWGSPPGLEAPGEPTAEMKLQTLLSSEAAHVSDLRMAWRAQGQ